MTGSLNTIFSTLKKFYKYGIPTFILLFGDSLGDNLLLTTIAKGLYNQGDKNIWIKCDHAFLFQDNPYIKLVLPFNELLSTFLLKLFRVKIVNPIYTHYDPDTDRDQIPEKHIILKMADTVGLKGRIANKPDLYLSPAEESSHASLVKRIVIVTSTKGAKYPMRNKEWIMERYQQIVDKFCPDYQFIQLGTANDGPLNHVYDLRGKTSVRDTASILKSSVLMISHVGFMMHLARSVDCPSVIIYGGREKPEQSGYSCFENIYSDIECSPCWFQNKCDYKNKCMTAISAEIVEQAVLNQLRQTGKPLSVDVLYND